MTSVNLKQTIAGVDFKNPILGASGTFGYGLLYEDFYPLESLGGFVTKGLSLLPKVGNPPPRITETPSGMLNAIGLQNIGLEKFVTKKIPKLGKIDTKVVVNFFGSTSSEYAEMASKLNDVQQVAALEMNISCPNVKEGGIAFGVDPVMTAEVVKACREATKKPLFVKLSPNVTDIATFAKVCEDEGADAISAINTLVGMAIDINTKKPVLANITGGLSGPAIKPVAIKMVWDCYKAVSIPIFGIGGISSANDVAEFILAGATAVQIGSHNFVEPDIGRRLVGELELLLDKMGVSDISQLIGAAHQ
jgi:dihydroorotate dehydrogenase (NAD+) catalytic subunit